jgi:hypothetical protein
MDLPGLNFQPGVRVQVAIHNRFDESINSFPILGLKEFYPIVLVGSCKYRLSETLIGLILQATLGTTAADFRPQQSSDRVFKFVVVSKNVVFIYIYILKFFSYEQY